MVATAATTAVIAAAGSTPAVPRAPGAKHLRRAAAWRMAPSVAVRAPDSTSGSVDSLRPSGTERFQEPV